MDKELSQPRYSARPGVDEGVVYHTDPSLVSLSKVGKGTGEMAQRLRTRAALPENPGSVSNTVSQVAQRCT